VSIDATQGGVVTAALVDVLDAVAVAVTVEVNAEDVVCVEELATLAAP
jgi:hypothetical protein